MVLIAGETDPSSANKAKILVEEANQSTYADLTQKVQEDLAPRCLLTTRLHAVSPCYIWFLYISA